MSRVPILAKTERARYHARMETPRLLITTVVWNHRDRLPLLLKSIEDQTRQPNQVLVLDAASQDGVSTWLAQSHPQVSALRLFHHHGLPHIWRQAAKFSLQRIPAAELAESWIFFVSPEVLLAKDVCERLLKEGMHLPQAAAIGPAVLRAWYQGEGEDGLDQIEPTELVESLGFELKRSFAWKQRGQGGSLRSFENVPHEVFGLAPVAVAYRADELSKLLELGGLSLPWKTTDAMFFDLGWRLRFLDKKSYILPDALSWRVERKGDGTSMAHWTERVTREHDRKMMVRLHLFGLQARVVTFAYRWFEAVSVWPYQAWCFLTRRGVSSHDHDPDAKTVLKQAKQARVNHEASALRVYTQWLFAKRVSKPERAKKTMQPKEGEVVDTERQPTDEVSQDKT